MAQPIVQIDAFTGAAFRGNPAAVCLMDGPADPDWMQSVALEMNLSETAFVYREDALYNLRWFTPAKEVRLCGHATLATAHMLFEDSHVSSDETIRFATLSGELRVARPDGKLEMDFPALTSTAIDPPDGLLEALGIKPVEIVKNEHDILVQVADESEVLGCNPDFTALKRISTRGVIVTARQGGDYDFVSRFFAPGAGVNEDPVTGSAHCALTPYWSQKLDKNSLHAYQASARGGELWLRLEGERVKIAGEAIIVMRGELLA